MVWIALKGTLDIDIDIDVKGGLQLLNSKGNFPIAACTLDSFRYKNKTGFNAKGKSWVFDTLFLYGQLGNY
jgi:hypothetical protein